MDTIKQLTDEELQAELRRREQSKKDAERQKREDYEATREQIVKGLTMEAMELSEAMTKFKQKAFTRLMNFRSMADEYGDVRGNSKGGFALRSTDGTMRVALERNTKQEYDERANLGEQLIREFLTDMVKRRNLKTFELVTSLLQRGDKGEFNPANIQTLISKEALYDDERWKRAMQLFKEAHNTILISMNVAFYVKNDISKDSLIPLTFASLPVVEEPDPLPIE